MEGGLVAEKDRVRMTGISSPVSLVLLVCKELCRLAAAEELRGGCECVRVIRMKIGEARRE